jgi:hypothetical protein
MKTDAKLGQQWPRSIFKNQVNISFMKTATFAVLSKSRVHFATHVEIFLLPCIEQKTVHFAADVEIFIIARLDYYAFENENDLCKRNTLFHHLKYPCNVG